MTTKTLYLLRHAKAVPAEPAADDHERPLNERGERDALRLGQYLRHYGICPALTLCSTSLRTRQTLHLLEQGLDAPLNVRFASRLYLASPKEVIDQIHAVEDPVKELMILGHNPTLHQLCADLVDSGDSALVGEMTRRFPTSALAEIQYPATEWSEIGPCLGVLQRFVIPKQLSPVEG